MTIEEKIENVYKSIANVAAVYTFGKSTKELVVIYHDGDKFKTQVWSCGMREHGQPKTLDEVTQWLNDVLFPVQSLMGETRARDIFTKIKFRFGTNILQNGKS